MTVQEDFVWGEGYGNGSKADDERCNMMIGGLSSLIHFADQQYFSSMTDTYTDYILDFLASQGVDTSREFVINGTHCELVNGKIREVTEIVDVVSHGVVAIYLTGKPGPGIGPQDVALSIIGAVFKKGYVKNTMVIV